PARATSSRDAIAPSWSLLSVGELNRSGKNKVRQRPKTYSLNRLQIRWFEGRHRKFWRVEKECAARGRALEDLTFALPRFGRPGHHRNASHRSERAAGSVQGRLHRDAEREHADRGQPPAYRRLRPESRN